MIHFFVVFSAFSDHRKQDMIHHCKGVRAACNRVFVIGDMPFGSYECTPEEAVRNAVRLIKEGEVDAVKMEGGKRVAASIAAVVAAGIPVVGHVGLTPQTAESKSGFKVQGRSAEAAEQILTDAVSVQQAGAFMVVLEMIPTEVAAHVTSQLNIPTIGIGAGRHTSGQVLVLHDMLGLYPHLQPKFCKKFLDVGMVVKQAIRKYVDETQRGFVGSSLFLQVLFFI